ncbi:MAG TPA: hypothetical protein VMR02_14040 [Terracidiphilus sp.]|nr:hypothetical protein [Terracidiphilus sp.]
MTDLRYLMIGELQRRNFAETTIRSYVHGVSHFIPRKLITRMRPPQQRLRSSRNSIA